MSSSGESIAQTVRQLRRGDMLFPSDEAKVTAEKLVFPIDTLTTAPVIDLTAVYDDFMVHGEVTPWAIYEDSVMRPPFNTAIYGHTNKTGSVMLVTALTSDRKEYDEEWASETGEEDGWITGLTWESMADTHTIDWDRVRWVTACTLWTGGFSERFHQRTPLVGPVHSFIMAVYEDGQLADIRWEQLIEEDPDIWSNSIVTFLKGVTMSNCANVEILPPKLDRPEQRRRDRIGISVSELHIVPVSQYRRRNEAPRRLGSFDTPLSTVRGHVARYGPDYGRGLLFGKFAGQFWISPHIRGHGEGHQQQYSVET